MVAQLRCLAVNAIDSEEQTPLGVVETKHCVKAGLYKS